MILFRQSNLPFLALLSIIKSTRITNPCFLLSIFKKDVSYFCFSSVNDNKIRSNIYANIREKKRKRFR